MAFYNFQARFYYDSLPKIFFLMKIVSGCTTNIQGKHTHKSEKANISKF